MGDRVARKIERKFDLPEFWMDTDHQPAPAPDELPYDKARYARLPVPVREEITWYIAQKIRAHEGRPKPRAQPAAHPVAKTKAKPPPRKRGASEK